MKFACVRDDGISPPLVKSKLQKPQVDNTWSQLSSWSWMHSQNCDDYKPGTAGPDSLSCPLHSHPVASTPLGQIESATIKEKIGLPQQTLVEALWITMQQKNN